MSAAFTAPTGEVVLSNGSRIAADAPAPSMPSSAELAAMGPTQRQNAFARAFGGVEVPVPLSETLAAAKAAPPSTVSRTPPSPGELEASRIASFDADMRAAGIQRPPGEARGAPVAPQVRDAQGRFLGDPPGVVQLKAAYAALPPAEREARAAQFQAELVEFFEGRQPGESRADFAARRGTQPPASAPSPGTPPPGQPPGDLGPDDPDAPYWNQARTDARGRLTTVGQQLEARIRQEFAAGTPQEQRDPANIDATNVALVSVRANEHGMAPVEAFHPDMLHGYQLPRLLADQHYDPDIIPQLARAKAAGITQAQLEQYVREDMRSRGYEV